MSKTDDAQGAEGPAIPEDRTLLLVDDDVPFLTRLARAMEGRGFDAVSYTHLTLPTKA